MSTATTCLAAPTAYRSSVAVADNDRIRPGQKGYLDLSNGVEILDRPTNVNRSMGDVHPLGNPHYWLDPDNGKSVAKAIADKFSQLRPNDGAHQELEMFGGVCSCNISVAPKVSFAIGQYVKGATIVGKGSRT